MLYMVIYVTLTILTEHGILSLLRAKLSLFIRFNTYNIGQIDIFCFKKHTQGAEVTGQLRLNGKIRHLRHCTLEAQSLALKKKTQGA